MKFSVARALRIYDQMANKKQTADCLDDGSLENNFTSKF